MRSSKEKVHSNESPERAKLRKLEEEGEWVFHGSGQKTEVLEPRQSYNYSAEGKEPDGKPAVFASPRADIAIFMAIINKSNLPKGLRSGFSSSNDENYEFYVTESTMAQLHNVRGYVHVFDKSKFITYSPGQVVSYEPAQPVEVIEVTEKDLPQDIIIKDF